ncbi:PREDICTED: uncharacterized protein LOC109211340 [Nicotiana attenuata]|uniref:uncharacterized protein LOC109211340 n=1 Tax=Nicotiana attenuata TaxID=49451 RepID=UPI0009048EC7|nr:PREDICTED: uncharacterized protein LOC109211340 [Nicotiana attenuata]
MLKKELKSLNRQYFRNNEREANEDRAALKHAQSLLQTDPLNSEWQLIEKEKYQKFRHSSYLAEMYLQQKNKATWIKLGDENTSYNAIIGSQNRLENTNLIWNEIAQPKHRFITWLAVQERLLTKERSQKLDIHVEDSSCCLCDAQENETVQHLFVDCTRTQDIRKGLLNWLGLHVQVGEVQQGLEEINRKHWKRFKKEVAAALWEAMIYHIWRGRNRKLFEELIEKQS